MPKGPARIEWVRNGLTVKEGRAAIIATITAINEAFNKEGA